jgi:Trypsin
MRRRVLALFAALAVLTGLAVPAAAIVGGEPDGDGHPMVARILWVDPSGARYACSATLVSDRVLVTAGHCTDAFVGQHIVTFESTAPLTGSAPSASTGYNATNVPDGYVLGTGIPHPLWTGKLRNKDLFDTGVVVLDEPVSITPAQLVSRSYFDDKSTTYLKAEPFTAVGYGVRFEKAADGPQKRTAVSDRIRKFTDSPLKNINGEVILLSESDTDSRYGGGTCFGDSGGALFYRDMLVGDTSFGGSQFCEGLGGYQRLDSPEVYDWLADRIAEA